MTLPRLGVLSRFSNLFINTKASEYENYWENPYFNFHCGSSNCDGDKCLAGSKHRQTKNPETVSSVSGILRIDAALEDVCSESLLSEFVH